MEAGSFKVYRAGSVDMYSTTAVTSIADIVVTTA